MELSVPIILGTARDGRNSEAAARFVYDHLRENYDKLDTEFIDVRNYLFGQTYEAWNDHPDQPQIAEWKKTADQADGFIIVTPEYNHGYPGELKLLLDAAFEEYFDKPVGVVGVSGGGFGGARVVELIKPTLIELGMTVVGNAAYISNVGEAFTENGEVVSDKREQLTSQIDDMTDELIRYGKALQQTRRNSQ